MKDFISVLVVAVLLPAGVSIASQRPYTGPLLAKSTQPGFTLQSEYLVSECEIYADKVVIKKGVADLQAVTEKPINLSGPIHDVIRAVQEAPRKEESGPADVPTTSYILYGNVGAGGIEKVTFHREGEFAIITTADEGRKLKNFIDQSCSL